MQRLFAVAALAFVLACPATDAATLRWSSQGDYLTADPMAQNELLTNSIRQIFTDGSVSDVFGGENQLF